MSIDSPEIPPAATSTSIPEHRAVVHGPEKRLFDGIRTWVDVFPWLRLVRVCRIAGGPVWVLHTLIVSLVWALGVSGLGGRVIPENTAWDVIPIGSLPVASSTMPSDAWSALPHSGFGVVLNGPMVLWSVVVWTPTMMALLRVGALLTAGWDMPSYVTTFRAVGRRLRGAAVIVLLPTVLAAFFAFTAWLATWLAVVIGGSSEHATWATWMSLPIVLPAALIAGLLVLAGKFAIALGLTASMIEPDADPIDALSRGYEYTLRRLPQFALLMIVGALISMAVILAWTGLSLATRGIVTAAGMANPPLLICLAILPSVIAVMLLWSMLGGIYLLLRQSAGGQEVEDLPIDSGHWKSPKMPSVQRQ